MIGKTWGMAVLAVAFVPLASLAQSVPDPAAAAILSATSPPAPSAPAPLVGLSVRANPPRFQEVSFAKMGEDLATIAVATAALSGQVFAASYMTARTETGVAALDAAKVLALVVAKELPPPGSPVLGPASPPRLEDPAGIVALDLASAYAAKQAALVNLNPVVVENDSIGPIIAASTGARYIIDVTTTKWGYQYYSLDLGHFGAIYGARMRLIDASTGVVVAKGGCSYTTKKPPNPPTHAELMANGGAVMRGLLTEAALACAAKLKAEALKL